jgi:DNA-binding NtrC family response regulator
MTMPQLTGARLAKKILKIRPDIPIVLCTGYNDNITEGKAKQIGIAEFVYKPLLLHDLAKVTRKSLGKK